MNPSTYDITVEDPSDGFVRLRDYVDCCNALQLPAFQPPTIHGLFQGAILTAATEILKLHKVQRSLHYSCYIEPTLSCLSIQSQARRVYEILRLQVTDCSNPAQYRNYRLAVKNRLNAPHQVTDSASVLCS